MGRNRPVTTITDFIALAARLRRVIYDTQGDAVVQLEAELTDTVENCTRIAQLTDLERLLLEAMAEGLGRKDLLDRLAERN
jgi:hypothetical protein